MRAIGKREYGKHLRGEKLSPREAILAQCYWCSNLYNDGKNDCEVKDCVLYPFYPYKPKSIDPATEEVHSTSETAPTAAEA